jgi:hypothetical protein
MTLAPQVDSGQAVPARPEGRRRSGLARGGIATGIPGLMWLLLVAIGCSSGKGGQDGGGGLATAGNGGRGGTGGGAGGSAGASGAAGSGGRGGSAGGAGSGNAGGAVAGNGGAGSGNAGGSAAGNGGAGGGNAGGSSAGNGGAGGGNGGNGGGSAAGGGGAGGGNAGGSGAGNSGSGGTPPPTWSWVGVVGTGQSLAVGGHGNAPAMTIGATTQPFHNLKLSLGNAKVPPFDPTNGSLSMVPLVEPLRAITTVYPSPYPANIYGETVHTAMADQITSLAKAGGATDYVTTHTEVGEAGQPIGVLEKGATDTGTTGRAYAASLFEVAAIARLAKAQGKSYGVGAILLTQGESDADSTTFETDMLTLWSSYNQDLPSLTGQTGSIPMLLSQQSSSPMTAGSSSPATQAQWKIGVDHPGSVICTGPKYQYSYVSDYPHLDNRDYERLGEKYAQVFYQRVALGNDWQPLQPTGASRSGRVITVTFHVPVEPLAWDTTLPAPHQSANTAWAQGKGFEVGSGGTPIGISGVAISGDTVQITCATDLPASGLTVAYAWTTDGTPRASGTVRWGLLHDADPFVGYLTGMPGQNYAVAFQMNVP